jgi:rSAM/selenodomain-associated transferase 1
VDAGAAPRRNAVLVFVRAPQPGRVKTRLAAALGDEAAVRVYRRLAEHTLAEARALAPAASLRIHCTPPQSLSAVSAWLGPGAEYLPQHGGGLGERLRTAFDEAFAAGFDHVVVVGSDLPDLSAEHLRAAFDALDQAPAVIGPARDGGYWLLGLAGRVPGVFDGIPWSTDEVFARTVYRLRAAGMEPALLPVLADVDEAADLPPDWREWAVREPAAAAGP